LIIREQRKKFGELASVPKESFALKMLAIVFGLRKNPSEKLSP
jgi:hypothetical protein